MSRPRAEFKDGAVKLTCWQNEKGVTYSIGKRYKAADGTWKDSKVWFDSDIPRIVSVCNQCLDWLAEEKREQEKLSDMVSVPAEDDDDIAF